MSCQSINIDRITKQIITPGRPSGVITLRYSTLINTPKKIQIEKIVNQDTPQEKLDFFSTNTENGVAFNNKAFLEKGSYLIQISTPYEEFLKNTSEILIFYIIDQKGKQLVLEGTSVMGEKVRMK